MVSIVLIGSFIFLFYQLISKIGKSFPLFELVGVLYLLQYGIAPMIEYQMNPYNVMALPEDKYLWLSTMSCYAFILGLLTIKVKFDFSTFKISPLEASKLGRVLLIIGIGSQLAMLLLPAGLRSIMNFFILFRVIGVYALIYSNNKTDKYLIVIIYFWIALNAIIDALLVEFIVFSVFFFMFYALKHKISKKAKYTAIILSFAFLTVYQGIKQEYREYAWGTSLSSKEKLAVLTNLITIESFTELFKSNPNENESLMATISRLNQGWQTSMVYARVPSRVDFEKGNDLANDIFSSLLPRFLWPQKRTVNDPERFEYYTGYRLNGITSMSIGVLGDYYVNFGFEGSLVALYLFGLFLGLLTRWYYRRFFSKNPINLIWLPFIFSYLIRPGNEFYMVFNHIIKALIVFYFIRKFLYPYIEKLLSKEYSQIEA